MKPRSMIIAWIIIIIPFLIGGILILADGMKVIPGEMDLIENTILNNQGIEYKGIRVDWIFCPDWKYKPLLIPAEEYLVFVFHYENNNDYPVWLMPSYTLSVPPHRRIAANEEISIYIKNTLKDKFHFEDQTAITFSLLPDLRKHYIVTFEKPLSLTDFNIEVDVFKDVTLRVSFKKENGSWHSYKRELINKYWGRG